MCFYISACHLSWVRVDMAVGWCHFSCSSERTIKSFIVFSKNNNETLLFCLFCPYFVCTLEFIWLTIALRKWVFFLFCIRMCNVCPMKLWIHHAHIWKSASQLNICECGNVISMCLSITQQRLNLRSVRTIIWSVGNVVSILSRFKDFYVKNVSISADQEPSVDEWINRMSLKQLQPFPVQSGKFSLILVSVSPQSIRSRVQMVIVINDVSQQSHIWNRLHIINAFLVESTFHLKMHIAPQCDCVRSLAIRDSLIGLSSNFISFRRKAF